MKLSFNAQSTSAQAVSVKETWHAPLNRVTPVSKVLAATIFIILPFMGFWLGVQYSAEAYTFIMAETNL